MESDPRLSSMISILERIKDDLTDCHPKAVLLFGSLARAMGGDPVDHLPNDIDLLVVTNNTPYIVMQTNYGFPLELHSFTIDRIVGIARSLRYDSRPVALSKLYGRVLAKEHAIDVIAAAMLLGSGYDEFGIQQIEIKGLTDTRDYSIHRVLAGKQWWDRLCRYARQRRGPLRRFVDKVAYTDRFRA